MIKKDNANEIFDVYLWYTPYSEIVIVGRELIYVLEPMGIEVVREADYHGYFAFNQNGMTKGRSTGAMYMFEGAKGKRLLDTLTRSGHHYVTIKEAAPRFGEEVWMRTNSIRKN